MLEVTENAAKVLDDNRKAQGVPDNFGVRISAEPLPEGGAAVRIAFVEAAVQGDEVVEQHGAQVYVAPELAEPLAEASLAVEKDDEGEKLVLKGPGLAS